MTFWSGDLGQITACDTRTILHPFRGCQDLFTRQLENYLIWSNYILAFTHFDWTHPTASDLCRFILSCEITQGWVDRRPSWPSCYVMSSLSFLWAAGPQAAIALATILGAPNRGVRRLFFSHRKPAKCALPPFWVRPGDAHLTPKLPGLGGSNRIEANGGRL